MNPTTPTRQITFACGHKGDLDVSRKPRAEWASYAKWATKRMECPQCFSVTRAHPLPDDDTNWREKRDTEISQWEQKNNMPTLAGSDKQIAWARSVRYNLLTHAWNQGTFTQEDYANAVTAPARAIHDAHWWIDQKDEPINDVPELVQTYEAHTGND